MYILTPCDDITSGTQLKDTRNRVIGNFGMLRMGVLDGLNTLSLLARNAGYTPIRQEFLQIVPSLGCNQGRGKVFDAQS